MSDHCGFCPPQTTRCAHLLGHWVRLVKDEPSQFDDSPWGVFWSWPEYAADTGFYFTAETRAMDQFDALDVELRDPYQTFGQSIGQSHVKEAIRIGRACDPT